MTAHLILNYFLLWSLIGMAAFSLIVLYLFRSGQVYDARTEEGHLKKAMPLKGLFNILLFLAVVVGFMASTNHISLISQGTSLNFWPLFGLNLALILILIVYDTLVIDWWVIGLLQPDFFQLPDAMDKEQMKVHIRRTFVVAPLYAILLAFLSAAVTLLVW